MTARRLGARCRWCGGPNVREGSSVARILDLLEEHDEGWWTGRQLAERTGLSLGVVRRTLAELLKAQLLAATRSSWHDPYRYRRRRREGMPDRSWPPTITHGYMCSCGEFLPDPHRVGYRHVLSAHHEDHVLGGRTA